MSPSLLQTGKFPHLVKLIGSEPHLTTDEIFEAAVRWILDGVAADLHLPSGR
jgi:hypothetical protein